MERYLAFAYSGNDPQGGINDFIGSYESIDVAIHSITKNEHVSRYGGRFGYFEATAHIYDSELERIVWEDGKYK